jgi:hypothetical protein
MNSQQLQAFDSVGSDPRCRLETSCSTLVSDLVMWVPRTLSTLASRTSKRFITEVVTADQNGKQIHAPTVVSGHPYSAQIAAWNVDWSYLKSENWRAFWIVCARKRVPFVQSVHQENHELPDLWHRLVHLTGKKNESEDCTRFQGFVLQASTE